MSSFEDLALTTCAEQLHSNYFENLSHRDQSSCSAQRTALKPEPPQPDEELDCTSAPRPRVQSQAVATGTPCSSVVVTQHFSPSHTTCSRGSLCHFCSARAATHRTRHPGALWTAALKLCTVWVSAAFAHPIAPISHPPVTLLILWGTRKGNRI